MGCWRRTLNLEQMYIVNFSMIGMMMSMILINLVQLKTLLLLTRIKWSNANLEGIILRSQSITLLKVILIITPSSKITKFCLRPLKMYPMRRKCDILMVICKG
jgi:hypothetical protein